MTCEAVIWFASCLLASVGRSRCKSQARRLHTALRTAHRSASVEGDSRQPDQTVVASCVRAVRLCRRSTIAYSAIRGFTCLALALVALLTIVFRVTGEIIFIIFTYFVCDLSGLNLYGYSISIIEYKLKKYY